MFTEAVLLGSSSFMLNDMIVDTDMITLAINSIRVEATCPKCRKQSQRVHSLYWRTAADLPLAGLRVRLRLLVRRFFCDNHACRRKTFAERFPELVTVYARRTQRLAFQQRQVGLSLGGQAGAKLLDSIAMPTSGDTVLRLVKGVPASADSVPRVLGVDDWAWSKGRRYGTILVDLEQHHVVDLLPERSAETLAAWLRAHPGIQIISRDRALEYIKGIEQGAPDAVQIADRWHLLRNLADALIRLLDQNRACLYAVAAEPVVEPAPEPLPAEPGPEPIASSAPTKLEQRQQEVRERRLARYQAIMDLHGQGIKVRAIARQLGIGRGTVQRYLKAGGFPEMSKRSGRSTILGSYLPYLQRRWDEGCHNGLQLYREIEQKGYCGSRPSVSRWVARMRKLAPPRKPRSKAGVCRSKETVTHPWSARCAVWLLLKQPEMLEPDKKAALERMLNASPVLQPAYNFAQAFIRMVRNRYSRGLRPWLDAVIENKIPELAGFAKSIQQDFSAVYAALSLPWSNGQVEGQVNRLKMIKRQMYGRAGFDLLRVRVMAD